MSDKMKAYAVAEGEGMKWRGERVAPKYPENLEHKVVDALAAAGLLATPEMRETMKCLTGKAADAVRMSGGLVGVRLGIESDFVTPAMRQAVEACCEYARRKLVAPHHWQQELIEAGDAILAERASREKPEPMWLPDYGHGTMRWWVKSQKDGERSGPFDTESQARCVAEALNREGGGRG